MAKQKVTKKRRFARAAAKCHNAGIRDVITSKSSAKKHRAHQDRKLGKFGAASAVRRIDPLTGETLPQA